MQLQIAEEERRIQRKSEIMANEALIRKLEEEEQQKLAQYAQDQLFAKTIAKKQLLTKATNPNFYSNSMNIKMPSNEIEILPLNGGPSIINNVPTCYTKNERTNTFNTNTFNTNCDLDKSSQQSENLVLDVKVAANRKEFCQGPVSVHSVVTLNNQSVMVIGKANSYYSEPSCSNSKIYGTRSEEELRVPSDVLPSGKNLGIEFCIKTIKNEDERIGRAESAGSHDSINQEIHHFKPIRAMPRTPLRFSEDGRQIDPKLIRVVPIFERVSNAPPKPPTPSKRIIGCSWSAFRGKNQQNPHGGCATDWKASNSLAQCYQTAKPTKRETIRKIDLAKDIFDNNKNYAKGMHRVLNGTKVSKKLILDDETDNIADKTWKKCKNSNEKKDFSADENSSPSWNRALLKIPLSNENGAAIENIAERIKKRKVAQSQAINPIINKIQSPRKTRSRTVSSNKEAINLSLKLKRKMPAKSKSLKLQFTNTTEIIESPLVSNVETEIVKVKRNSLRPKRKESVGASNQQIESVRNKNLDDMAIEEQSKIESLLRQEKEDYELAQRLQAQFNEVGSISYRTRGSKRAFDSGEIERGIDNIRINGRLLVDNVNTAKTSSRATKSRRRQKRD
ncbi:uncharacterized protein LOC107045842 isoform X2 [Diachasma alloeum]|nr:uncharacterized protein LOC107045842 isoform X2 [Diachasma alloeum]